MNEPLRRRNGLPPRLVAVVLLVAMGALGAAAGVMVERSLIHPATSRSPDRRDRVPVWARSPEEHREYWNRIMQKIGTTPAQVVAIDSILAGQSRELEAARREAEPRFREIMKTTRSRIEEVLTPEQRERFQALRREHRAKHREPSS